MWNVPTPPSRTLQPLQFASVKGDEICACLVANARFTALQPAQRSGMEDEIFGGDWLAAAVEI